MHAKVASSQELTEALAAVWAHLTKGSSSDLFRVVDELGLSFSQVKMLFLLEDSGERSLTAGAANLVLSLPPPSRLPPPPSSCHPPPPPERSTGSSSVVSSRAANPPRIAVRASSRCRPP